MFTYGRIGDPAFATAVLSVTLSPMFVAATVRACTVDEDCDDGIACTIDTCNASFECEYAYDDEYCDDGLYCNGNEVCDPEYGCVTEPGSIPNCDDGTDCTMDECAEIPGGYQCVHDPNPGAPPNCVPCDEGEIWPDCDDEVECTEDTCSPVHNWCVFAPNDDLCPDDGLFCNGDELCDPENPDPELPVTGCGHGTPPCPPDLCDEENDSCAGACDPPIVEAVGGRYLAITPGHAEGTTAAFLVTYCDGTISKYVGRVVDDWLPRPNAEPATLGFLVNDPADAVYRTPAEWGGTVYATGLDLVPATEYQVQADCPGSGSSMPVDATYIDRFLVLNYGTWDWADRAPPPDHAVTIEDIMAHINAFQGLWEHQGRPVIRPNLDIGPASGAAGLCEPDQVNGIGDILLTIQAFTGNTWADTFCPHPCAP